MIAVSGTGVDTHHPDLVNNLVPGYDFFDDDNTPDPINEDPLDAHDTLCAGIAAAQGNNGIGIAGVAYDCRIMPIRIGTWTSWYTEADRAMSFRWGAAHGADVFSCSWTARSAPTIRSAVRDVTQPGGMGRQGKGCVVVFAAGNEGAIFSDGPAAYPEVLAVGATDHNDVRWPYSSYGPELDIMAASGCSGDWCGTLAAFWSTDQTGPDGWSIHNSDPNILDYAQYIGGTSASCPIVAGVAVLILSIEPGLTSAEVRHFLCRSAKDLGDPGPDDYYGWGRVDARAALDMVLAKRADLNHDWRVDEDDRAILVKAMETNDLTADIAPAAKRDGVVDAKDLEMLMRYWDTQIPEVPEQGLIAHWKLDETEGSVAHNTTGDRVYNANVHGKPSWQPEAGRIGGALAFDGKDDRISAPCAVNPAESPISVFAWVKGGSPGQVVISQSGKADWLMAAAPNGGLKTALSPAGLPALTTDVVITDDQWHRIGLVWDGTQRSLYADDALVAQDSPPGLASSPGTLFIGAGNKLAKGSFWTGLIDDVRLYDRAVKP